jgi:hypothetical protein
MIDADNMIEETKIDPREIANKLEPTEVAPDEKFTIENSNDANSIELYIIIDEEPVIEKSKSGEFSFYPPNKAGIHIYNINCSWGWDLDSQALYVFKVEVTELLGLTSDIEKIVNEFGKAGLKIYLRKYVSQFLFVDPIVINIDEEMVKIYKYESEEEMEFQRTLIGTDGYSIMTLDNYNKNKEDENIVIVPTQITWSSSPHFYSKDDLIAFYVGENETILNILEEIFGKQFAGC